MDFFQEGFSTWKKKHTEIQLKDKLVKLRIKINPRAQRIILKPNHLNNSIEQIEAAIMNTLFTTPPALSADIYNTGLYLTGGGSILRGLDKRISQKTKLPVYVAEDPLRAVARGTGIALKNTDSYTFLMR